MKAPHKKILKMPVAVTSYEDTGQRIIQAAREGVGKYVCASNVHMCMEAYDSASFSKVVNEADLVVPDGVPLVWWLKSLGEKNATQVRGSDLLLHLCKEAEKTGIPIGLYGGTEDSLLDFIAFLKKEYPSLQISFSSSPPFRELSKEEKAKYVQEINESRCQILFVGIGCPKQEKWMAEHREKLSCVMIGIGAAFDFFSGRKKHAPRWMQRNGIEWLYRLASDPRRLWKRYFKHNPRFLYHFGRHLLTQRFSRKRSAEYAVREKSQLLLSLLRTDPITVNKRSVNELAAQVTDWPFFIQLCQQHGLLGILSRNISRHFPDIFPAVFSKNSHKLSFHNAVRSMSLTRSLIQILDLFSQNSIAVLPFKGPLLAQEAYGDVGIRTFSDLDILISRQNASKAIRLLIDNGFVAEVDNIKDKIETFSKQEDNLSLMRSKDGCLVELHWDISGCYLAEALTLSDIHTPFTVSLAGCKVQSLSIEDLLVYLCVHGAKHVWEKLEWLYSIGALLEKYPDLHWDTVWQRADSWKCQRMLLLGLQLSCELLGTNLPEEVKARISKDPRIPTLVLRVRKVLFPRQDAAKKDLRFSFFHLVVRDSFFDSVRYGLRLFFRPTVKEWQTWPLPLPLSFLYYFYRPLRLACHWGSRRGE